MPSTRDFFRLSNLSAKTGIANSGIILSEDITALDRATIPFNPSAVHIHRPERGAKIVVTVDSLKPPIYNRDVSNVFPRCPLTFRSKGMSDKEITRLVDIFNPSLPNFIIPQPSHPIMSPHCLFQGLNLVPLSIEANNLKRERANKWRRKAIRIYGLGYCRGLVAGREAGMEAERKRQQLRFRVRDRDLIG